MSKNKYLDDKNSDFPLLLLANNENNSKKDLINLIQLERNQLLIELHKHGAILFRGYNLYSEQDFKEVIKNITPELAYYVGGDSPREQLLDGVYTSTSYPKDQYISMHNEKSFSNIYPKYVFFFCQTAPEVGGETPILDGRRMFKLLNEQIIQEFSDRKLKYVMNLNDGPGIGKSWQEVFEIDDKKLLEEILVKLKVHYYWKENGMLRIEETVSPVIEHPVTKEKVFFSQADQWHPSNLEPEVLSVLSEVIHEDDYYHHCYYGDGEMLNLEYLDEIRNLAKRELVTFQWQQGDLLILDNILTLHGRFPFEGKRKILVSMA